MTGPTLQLEAAPPVAETQIDSYDALDEDGKDAFTRLMVKWGHIQGGAVLGIMGAGFAAGLLGLHPLICVVAGSLGLFVQNHLTDRALARDAAQEIGITRRLARQILRRSYRTLSGFFLGTLGVLVPPKAVPWTRRAIDSGMQGVPPKALPQSPRAATGTNQLSEPSATAHDVGAPEVDVEPGPDRQ